LAKKEEITEGRKAGRASRTKPPPHLVSSRSGFATAIRLIFGRVQLYKSDIFGVLEDIVCLETCTNTGSALNIALSANFR